MILYINENILNESVSGDDVIKAINDRVGVLITYNGEDNEHHGVRYIEPYVYGLTTANNPAIRAYQYYGDTKRGVPAWKLLRLDRIESWEPTENKFEIEPQARGWAAQAFNGDDKLLPTIYCVVELGRNPESDLDKLRARTRQLQQSKPVNINNINNIGSKPNQNNKQSGPLGKNEPDIGTNKPIDNDDNKKASTPLNTNGTPKNDTSKPPVMKEPKSNGPIVGDATNPDENKAEDLMSNSQFADMLRRNLELTNKERNRRGLNLKNENK